MLLDCGATGGGTRPDLRKLNFAWAHLGRTHRRCRDWVTDEAVALTEQVDSTYPKPLVPQVGKKSNALRRNYNAYCKAIAEETEGSVAEKYHFQTN